MSSNQSQPVRQGVSLLTAVLVAGLVTAVAPWTAMAQDDAGTDVAESALADSGQADSGQGDSATDAAGASGDAEAGGDGGPQEDPVPPGIGDMFVPIIGMGLIFYFIVLAPQKRERKKRQAMVDSLQKHDRVVTIGGIIGTVVAVDEMSDEVVLSVSPGNEIRMLRRSIQGPKPVGGGEDGGDEDKSDNK